MAERSISDISRTAMAVAAGRALGAREPDPVARNPDHLAEQFLSGLPIDAPCCRAMRLKYEEAMRMPRIASLVRMMTVRTKFIDESLSQAVARGAEQILILGAGLDSYAYRHSALEAARIFEVDKDQIQTLKKRCVAAVLPSVPENVRYIPVDLESESFEKTLIANGYDISVKTLAILEGVSMYLPAQALNRVLGLVARHSSGSGMVLDFLSTTPSELSWRSGVVPSFLRFFLPRPPASEPRFAKERQRFALGEEDDFFRKRGLLMKKRVAVSGEEAERLYLRRSDGTTIGGALSGTCSGPRNRYFIAEVVV